MQIGLNKAVFINYTLKDDEGEIIDTSEGAEPLGYLHGHNNIITGLETALEGKIVGDKLKVSIPPSEGYGEFNQALYAPIPKEAFKDVPDIEVGMQFEMPVDGGSQVFTIVNITDTEVTVDGNHPLAGETLNFDVEVMEIREATKEELEHGHIHSGDGHHH